MTIKEAESLLTKEEINELRKEHAKNLMRAKIREENNNGAQKALIELGLWYG